MLMNANIDCEAQTVCSESSLDSIVVEQKQGNVESSRPKISRWPIVGFILVVVAVVAGVTTGVLLLGDRKANEARGEEALEVLSDVKLRSTNSVDTSAVKGSPAEAAQNLTADDAHAEVSSSSGLTGFNTETRSNTEKAFMETPSDSSMTLSGGRYIPDADREDAWVEIEPDD